MECQRRAKSLVVLTLLQLCRAEIKDAQPQWYSANIINDGFQPKSISDMFSTEPSFSTSNPIIVAPKISNSLSDDITLLSKMSSPTRMAGFSSTTPFISNTYPSSSLSPPLQQQYMPHMNDVTNNQHAYTQINQSPSVEFQQQTSPQDFEQLQTLAPILKLVNELQSPVQPKHSVQIEQEQYTSQTLPSSSPDIKLTTFYQPPVTEPSVPREIQYEFPQDSQTSLGPVSQTTQSPRTIPPLSNYFLIYQQAPQSIQSNPNPSSSPQTIAGESFTTTAAPPVTSTFPSTFSSATPTFSSMGSQSNSDGSPVSIGTSPFYYSTTASPMTPQPLPPSSPRVTVTSLSTIGSSSSMGNSSSTRLPNCMTPKSTTPIPRLIGNPVPIPVGVMYPLKIKVQTPRGSITNVHINPATSRPALTTQKSISSTVSRRPNKRRTPKPRKNTYDRCLQGCRKNGQNLCAAPLAQVPIDPKTLRGFPSVCHMACHNSYRKDPYEKIVDGSCGRLRTRIRPIDSDYKLKRDELNKVKYILDNSRQPAIIELSGVYE